MIPAPYPPDTRAKGWRFELDYERISQSDTWALAGASQRPWLLMVWLTAWQQTPCGSLPDSDELIAARIGMPISEFAQWRQVLMRGWQMADDGRLYHPVITEIVRGMIEAKRKEAERKARYRANHASEQVQHLSHGTDAGQTSDSHGTDDTGTGTGTGTVCKPESTTILAATDEKPANFNPGEYLAQCGVSHSVANDWLQLRRTKKAPVSKTAISKIQTEAARAGMSLQSALELACANGWQGFRADWVQQGQSLSGQRADAFAKLTGSRPITIDGPKVQQGTLIDGEAHHVSN